MQKVLDSFGATNIVHMKKIILSSAAVLFVALSTIAQEPNQCPPNCEKKCTKKECSKGKCKDKACEKCTGASCDSKNKKCKAECKSPQTTTH